MISRYNSVGDSFSSTALTLWHYTIPLCDWWRTTAREKNHGWGIPALWHSPRYLHQKTGAIKRWPRAGGVKEKGFSSDSLKLCCGLLSCSQGKHHKLIKRPQNHFFQPVFSLSQVIAPAELNFSAIMMSACTNYLVNHKLAVASNFNTVGSLILAISTRWVKHSWQLEGKKDNCPA